ncbi:hypothetical protein ALP73_01444 [Pseudomonas coronafaciens pv. garcae]|uniref:Uncharacterized protein n=1 Tax=Pseudomonas coronafaciens pv. garcae TaxID=251653 RepID=A0AB37QT08_9PSED|nr:hypothetical protein ALQ80_200093 [Pseudomonas coronafaciens pv. oryzae]RMS04211.1 hypothetical protein ALP73_01444 [Pseudomonas coronafaciens pv. garcae]RMS05016.1 hypothetical protein ALP74_00902 [Pseudomonas coronafaciens pv. garcae]RMS18326.1 hypothetical protein ALP71_00717 [Pseudomonas coronafaciens pv. garcae]RMS92008.1 hypothetical protein ALP56_03450 [Pseudomonas coronafaciens pv. oryzae]
MSVNRFDYSGNLARATTYRGYRNMFWPPFDSYNITSLDLTPANPSLGGAWQQRLDALRTAIEEQWRDAKLHGVSERTRFSDPSAVAHALRELGDDLERPHDRQALLLRAKAIDDGYDNEILKTLAGLQEEVTLVAGQLATWYGKQTGGLPSAFGCQLNKDRQQDVEQAMALVDQVPAYLKSLHTQLRLGDVPAFAATDLFFMAGEGNLHPKHIAYFLPEDEGVKRSQFKKTYYFANTHAAMVECLATPLARQFLSTGTDYNVTSKPLRRIPTLGVLSHELGHFIYRQETTYSPLNSANRWTSVVLQEVAADVFGILVLAQVWAPALQIPLEQVLEYYLGECLRYLNRGLGLFPDCDGMYLQLSYFVQLGALTLQHGGDQPVKLLVDHGALLAGLRSLARVLADALLAGNPEAAVAFYQFYGPARLQPLQPLVTALANSPAQSIEYVQEPVRVPTDCDATCAQARL